MAQFEKNMTSRQHGGGAIKFDLNMRLDIDFGPVMKKSFFLKSAS